MSIKVRFKIKTVDLDTRKEYPASEEFVEVPGPFAKRLESHPNKGKWFEIEGDKAANGGDSDDKPPVKDTNKDGGENGGQDEKEDLQGKITALGGTFHPRNNVETLKNILADLEAANGGDATGSEDEDKNA